MKKINIAIDGYSGTGKSSTAKQVAKALGYKYVDSGAMYRAATLYMIQNKIDTQNETEVGASLGNISIDFQNEKVLLNNVDVTHEIRSMAVNENVSRVSGYRKVREAMVKIQQQIGDSKGVVMDGRDIGTVVFPGAELKIFMTSDIDIRTKRRQAELLEKGFEEEFSRVKENLIKRDKADTTRKESPLTKAKSAVEVDTSALTFEDQVDKIVNLAKAIAYES